MADSKSQMVFVDEIEAVPDCDLRKVLKALLDKLNLKVVQTTHAASEPQFSYTCYSVEDYK